MKTAVFIFLVMLICSPSWAKDTPEAVKDSKSGNLSIADKILLRPVIARIGSSRMSVLVGRISNKLEYVWSNIYKCYVRPKYAMVNAQALYNRYRE